jgi:hypothetical protein
MPPILNMKRSDVVGSRLTNLITDEQDEKQELKHDGGDGDGEVIILELFGLDAGRDDDQGGDEEFEPFVHGLGKEVCVPIRRGQFRSSLLGRDLMRNNVGEGELRA